MIARFGEVVQQVFGLDRDEVAECRRCGQSVANTTDHCPACGCDRIVVYDIE